MKTEREEILKVLGRAKSALAVGGVVPDLGYFWFDTTENNAAKKAKSYVYAHDGGFGIRLEYESGLKCGAPGKPLIDILNASVLKEVTLEAGKNSLTVKSGKSTTKLVASPADKKIWPYPDTPPADSYVISLDETFIEALRRTLIIRASKPMRVEHYGIMLYGVKKSLELYSTDSATMLRVVVPTNGKAEFAPVMLPRKFASEIVEECPEGVKLYVCKDCLIAEGDKITFYSNLLDVSEIGDMPRIVQSNLKEHSEPIQLPAGIGSALERAAILAGNDDAVVNLGVEKKELWIQGDYKLGKIDEILELEESGAVIEGRFNAQRIRRALSYSESFSLTKRSLVMHGPSANFVYLVSSTS